MCVNCSSPSPQSSGACLASSLATGTPNVWRGCPLIWDIGGSKFYFLFICQTRRRPILPKATLSRPRPVLAGEDWNCSPRQGSWVRIPGLCRPASLPPCSRPAAPEQEAERTTRRWNPPAGGIPGGAVRGTAGTGMWPRGLCALPAGSLPPRKPKPRLRPLCSSRGRFPWETGTCSPFGRETLPSAPLLLQAGPGDQRADGPQEGRRGRVRRRTAEAS